MSTTMLKGIAVAAALTVGALALATPAEAGRSSRNLAVGALIGLGTLASQSELIVMRASGVATGHIIWAKEGKSGDTLKAFFDELGA